jgi:alpha-tubulin suppressor-like RCC1 family protein
MKTLQIFFLGVLFLAGTAPFTYAQTTTPKIAVGANQSLVLTDDGTVYTFGQGNFGTLGQGHAGRYDIAAPITHANLGGKKIIASATNTGDGGDAFTLLVAEDSTVYSFGKNSEGQLGHGDQESRRDPTQITHANISGKKFVAVAAGEERSFLLASDGSVFGIGNNSFGYLGIGSTSPSEVLVPTLIDTTNLSGHTITQISVGGYSGYTLMLSDSNQVFAFGENSNGQFGNGSINSTILAVAIPKANFDNKTIVDIETGLNSSLVLASDGTVYSWGNFRSELGHGSLSADLLTPTAITHANLSGKTITNISKTNQIALLLSSDGTVFGFGNNNNNGFSFPEVPTEYTSSATLGKTISNISMGTENGLILADDGTVYGFGEGRYGQHGVGTTAEITTPRIINDAFTHGKVFEHVSAGVEHSVVIDSAGVAYSFGGSDYPDYNTSITNNHLGRSFDRIVNTPTELSHSNLSGETIVDVFAGGTQSFLLNSNGEVFAFGAGYNGALGLEDSVYVYVPTKLDHTNLNGKKISAIATGWNGSTALISNSSGRAHTLLLAEDGSVFAMGSNDAGQLGLGDFVRRRVPTQITHANISGKTITHIAVGASNSMLIASDGSVFLWGEGGLGEMGFGNTNDLNVPTLAGHISSLGKTFVDGAIGYSSNLPHFLLLADDNSLYSFGEGRDGQLGQGNKDDNYVPTQITNTNIPGKTISDVVAGKKTSMLVMKDGSVFSFGNTHRVGIEGGAFTDKTEPTLLNNAAIAGKKATAIAANSFHGLAILDDGSILSFGSTLQKAYRYGALGNGLPESGVRAPQPIANFNWRTSPIPTTNLALHLDAERGLATFGDSLNTWGNLRLSGNDGVQTDLARRPVAVDSVINNRRVIRFNGTNSYVTLPAASTLGIQNSDYELFMVAKSSSSDINFLLGGETIGQHELHLNGDAGARFIPVSNASNYVDVGSAGDFTDSTPQLINLQATDTFGKLIINRSQMTTNNTNAQSSNAGDIYLGVRTDNSFSFDGDIAEVIIYTGVLSATDRGKVEEYLVNKYAIPNQLNSEFSITGTEGWRLLAQPVADSSFAPLLSDLWTQGFTGAKSESGSPNVFMWDTTTATSDNTNWKALSRMDTTIQPGSAALVYVFSDDNYTDEGDAGFPKTLNVKGIEPLGTQNLSTKLNPNKNGFTLIGNPFRYDIDWDAFTKDSLSNSVYVYDHNTSGWKTWNGITGSLTDGEIGAYNGFFVQTLGASAKLEIPDSAKTYTTQRFLGKQAANPQYFSMEVSSESGLANKAWFQFSEDGKIGLDSYDAHKFVPLSSRYVSVASVPDETIGLDINNLPLWEKMFEIPLVLNTTETGIHSFSLKDINIPDSWTVELIDHESGIRSELGEAYVFTIAQTKTAAANAINPSTPPTISSFVSPATTKATDNRFTLRVSPSQVLSNESDPNLPQKVELGQNYPNPFNPSTTIQYGVPETGDVTLEVFNLLGRKVATLMNKENKSAGRYSVQFEAGRLASGLYLYRLKAGNTVITKKLTLIK